MLLVIASRWTPRREVYFYTVGQHDTFFLSISRITFSLIPHFDCTLFHLTSIGRPVYSRRWEVFGGTRKRIERKGVPGRKEREGGPRNNVRAGGGVQILRHCVPRLSHIWFTHIFLSILQGITKGSYRLRSANPREIVSYDRADVVQDASTSLFRRWRIFSALEVGWKSRIRVSGKNSVRETHTSSINRVLWHQYKT